MSESDNSNTKDPVAAFRAFKIQRQASGGGQGSTGLGGAVGLIPPSRTKTMATPAPDDGGDHIHVQVHASTTRTSEESDESQHPPPPPPPPKDIAYILHQRREMRQGSLPFLPGASGTGKQEGEFSPGAIINSYASPISGTYTPSSSQPAQAVSGSPTSMTNGYGLGYAGWVSVQPDQYSSSSPPPPPPPAGVAPPSYGFSSSTTSSNPASTYTYPTTTTTAASISGASTTPSTKKALSFNFLKFPMGVSKSPKSPLGGVGGGRRSESGAEEEHLSGERGGGGEGEPEPGREDENISMPWNFQHNIHVDEGYIGLPPSWSASLTTAGFSPEEILAIQQRRIGVGMGGANAGGMRYLYTDRPSSPAGGASGMMGMGMGGGGHGGGGGGAGGAQPGQILTPLPRSTSLPLLNGAPSIGANPNANVNANVNASSNPTSPAPSTDNYNQNQLFSPSSMSSVGSAYSNSTSTETGTGAGTGAASLKAKRSISRKPAPAVVDEFCEREREFGERGHGGGGVDMGWGGEKVKSHKPNQASGSTVGSGRSGSEVSSHQSHANTGPTSTSTSHHPQPQPQPGSYSYAHAQSRSPYASESTTSLSVPVPQVQVNGSSTPQSQSQPQSQAQAQLHSNAYAQFQPHAQSHAAFQTLSQAQAQAQSQSPSQSPAQVYSKPQPQAYTQSHQTQPQSHSQSHQTQPRDTLKEKKSFWGTLSRSKSQNLRDAASASTPDLASSYGGVGSGSNVNLGSTTNLGSEEGIGERQAGGTGGTAAKPLASLAAASSSFVGSVGKGFKGLGGLGGRIGGIAGSLRKRGGGAGDEGFVFASAEDGRRGVGVGGGGGGGVDGQAQAQAQGGQAQAQGKTAADMKSPMSDETFFALEGSELELGSPGFPPYGSYGQQGAGFGAFASGVDGGGGGGGGGGASASAGATTAKVWERYSTTRLLQGASGATAQKLNGFGASGAGGWDYSSSSSSMGVGGWRKDDKEKEKERQRQREKEKEKDKQQDEDWDEDKDSAGERARGRAGTIGVDGSGWVRTPSASRERERSQGVGGGGVGVDVGGMQRKRSDTSIAASSVSVGVGVGAKSVKGVEIKQRRRSRSQGSLGDGGASGAASVRSFGSQSQSQFSQGHSQTQMHVQPHTQQQQQPQQPPQPERHLQLQLHTARPTKLGTHKYSASLTSLESIPEASPAPGALVEMERGVGVRKGPAAGSSGRSGHGHGGGGGYGASGSGGIGYGGSANASVSSLGGSSASHHADGSSFGLGSTSTSTSMTTATSTSTPAFGFVGHVPQLPPLRSTHTAPPRLSIALHKHSDSLSSWSEALLTGISDLGVGIGGGGGGGGGNPDENGVGAGLTFDELIGRTAATTTTTTTEKSRESSASTATVRPMRGGPSPLGLELELEGGGVGGGLGVGLGLGLGVEERGAPMSPPVSGSAGGMRSQQRAAERERGMVPGGSRLKNQTSLSSVESAVTGGSASRREKERERKEKRERREASVEREKETVRTHQRDMSAASSASVGVGGEKGITPGRPIRKPGQPLPSSKPPPKAPAPLPPVAAAVVVGSSTSASGSATSLHSHTKSTSASPGPSPVPPSRKLTLGTSSSANSSSSSLAQPNSAGSTTSPVQIQAKGPVGGHIQATINKINERHAGAGVGGHDASASVSSSGHGHEQQQMLRLKPTPPAPFSPGILSPGGLNMNKPLPSPLPLGQGTMPGGGSGRHLPALPSAPATGVGFKLPPTPSGNVLPPQREGLLSPPPTAFKSPEIGIGILSPASSGGPDSAQLWNEIEQMMDPGMIANIPGLHISTALPPGAREVLKSAGVGGPSQGQGQGQMQVGGGGREDMGEWAPKTMRDLVGESPPASPMADNGSDYGDDEDVDEGDVYTGSVPIPPPKTVEPLTLRPGRSLRRDGGPSGGRALPSVSFNDGRGRETSQSRSRERQYDEFEDKDRLGVDFHSVSFEDKTVNRDSTRSSTSTITAMAHTTIVRNVSIARRTGAYVIGSGGRSPVSPLSPMDKPVPSPPSGGSSEEEGSGSVSGSRSSGSGSISIEHATPTTDTGLSSPLLYYLDGTQTPSPNPEKGFDRSSSPPSAKERRSARGEYDEGGLAYEDDSLDVDGYYGQEVDYPEEGSVHSHLASAGGLTPARPTIVISDEPASVTSGEGTATATGAITPLSPYQRYRGWLSDVVAPLEEFIDEQVDPREHYLDLNEIAEGESGSVFAATLNPETADKLRLPEHIQQQDVQELANEDLKMVAIKSVAIVPSGSPKLVDLQKELMLMKGLWNENVLGMDAVYVDLVEDSLWIRMELMERSLADIVGLVESGLMLQERTFARFASDVLLALDFLNTHGIAHRDVRSDNLLLNKHGVLKLADFSNAVQVPPQSPMREDTVGVAFWQAPEIRRGPYDALKVDLWSLGATVWEMAETQPPFADTKQLADRWPPMSQPGLYSPHFHDFLRKCSEPAASRPTPADMLKSQFIHNACGRPVIVQLLSQCMAIEKLLQEQEDAS